MASYLMSSTLRLARGHFGVVLKRRFAEAAAAHAESSEMPFTFASTEKVYYDQADIKQVDVPLVTGNEGILPNHVAMLGMLRPGVVTVYEQDDTQKHVFVSSGSITVNDDSTVQILAEEACFVEDLDVQAAKEGLEEARRESDSASDEKAKAEAEIKIEAFENLVQAAETGHS